jgi:hypothetical protein
MIQTFKVSKSSSSYRKETWPLYSFVTSNPLAGYEKMPFEQAVLQAKTNLTLRFSRCSDVS